MGELLTPDELDRLRADLVLERQRANEYHLALDAAKARIRAAESYAASLEEVLKRLLASLTALEGPEGITDETAAEYRDAKDEARSVLAARKGTSG